MKRKILAVSTFAGLALLTGCVQPQFDPNYRNVQFMNGKPYSIPYNVDYNDRPVNAKDVSYLKHVNIPCRKGDLVWYTRDFSPKIKNAQSGYEKAQIVSSLYHAGKLRCEHPLNKQEYAYRMNQMNQQSANKRTASQNNAVINAAAMPKTYNVNHTGSVYHYGY